MRPDVHRILEFAQAADRIDTLPVLTAALDAAVRPVGVTAVSATMIVQPGGLFRPRLLFGESWREWEGVYTRSRFQERDPAVRMLREQSRSFAWSEALARFPSKAAERVLDVCREVTGSGEGFVVPIRESDGAVLTAAFTGPMLEIDDELRPALHLAGYYFVTRGRTLLEGLAPVAPCLLTPRQADCLRLVLAGKTDDEIGAILGVSPRTAHNHIEAAKAALVVGKRSRAAFEAWRRGWLD